MNKTDIQIIKNNVKAQLEGKAVAPICIAGSPGTAKSTTVELIAEELNMNISIESAPTLTHEVLSGLPETKPALQFQENSIDGHKPYETIWSIPEMLSRALTKAKDKPTILLIDDFHMVAPHLQAYFYSLLLNKRLGNYTLPNNVAIVMTMNTSQDAGFNGINSAVRNRMSILEVEFNFDYWFDSFGKNLNFLVSSFLKANPQHCLETESSQIEGYATPRAWTALSEELDYYSLDFIEKNSKKLAVTQVSKDVALSFAKHINCFYKLNFEEKVKNKEIVNLSEEDGLQQILYAYIVRYINTLEDAVYLMDLINKNIDCDIFIGLLFGEIMLKMQNNNNNLSQGLNFILSKIIETPFEYPKNVSKQDIKKYEKLTFENPQKIYDAGVEFNIN